MSEWQKCPQCGEWSLESEWSEAEVYCEDCGSHPAARCPKCDEDADTVMCDLESEVRE